METCAGGACAKCGKPIVSLVWREGRQVVIVACENCDIQVGFDLITLQEYLGAPELTMPNVHMAAAPRRMQ